MLDYHWLLEENGHLPVIRVFAFSFLLVNFSEYEYVGVMQWRNYLQKQKT